MCSVATLRPGPNASTLAEALDCTGRRYQDLRAALDALLDDGLVDHASAAARRSSEIEATALAAEGRKQAEAFRDKSISAISIKGNGVETHGNPLGNRTA